MSTKSANPTVDTNQIMAAGLAATAAAFVTSRFGVAGTLIGAGLTAMIITGGSAIVKAYIESAAERARGAKSRFVSRREARPAEDARQEQAPTQPLPRQDTIPGRPDLRDNGVGRLRAALDWFRNLPTSRRRPILIKALLAAGVAFVICMVAVWGVEKVIGNSLSCGLWSSCPYGAAPGIHLAGFDDSGAGSSLSGGGVNLGGGGDALDAVRDNPILPNNAGDVIPGGDSPASASPAPGGGDNPSSASPDPEDPSSASPAAEQEASPAAEARNRNSDSSASPAP